MGKVAKGALGLSGFSGEREGKGRGGTEREIGESGKERGEEEEMGE
jgi:hypothetical protein